MQRRGERIAFLSAEGLILLGSIFTLLALSILLFCAERSLLLSIVFAVVLILTSVQTLLYGLLIVRHRREGAAFPLPDDEPTRPRLWG